MNSNLLIHFIFYMLCTTRRLTRKRCSIYMWVIGCKQWFKYLRIVKDFVRKRLTIFHVINWLSIPWESQQPASTYRYHDTTGTLCSTSPENVCVWRNICWVLRKGGLGGERNCFWHWKDERIQNSYVLCIGVLSSLLPNLSKTSCDRIHHLLFCFAFNWIMHAEYFALTSDQYKLETSIWC